MNHKLFARIRFIILAIVFLITGILGFVNAKDYQCYECIDECIGGLITDIPKDLIRAIAWQESNWRQFNSNGTISIDGNDIGIMRINKLTIEKHYHWVNLRRLKENTYYNLFVGVQIFEDKLHWIRELKKRDDWLAIKKKFKLYGNDMESAVRAYNGLDCSKEGVKKSMDRIKIIKKHRKEKPWLKHLKNSLRVSL